MCTPDGLNLLVLPQLLSAGVPGRRLILTLCSFTAVTVSVENGCDRSGDRHYFPSITVMTSRGSQLHEPSKKAPGDQEHQQISGHSSGYMSRLPAVGHSPVRVKSQTHRETAYHSIGLTHPGEPRCLNPLSVSGFVLVLSQGPRI